MFSACKSSDENALPENCIELFAPSSLVKCVWHQSLKEGRHHHLLFPPLSSSDVCQLVRSHSCSSSRLQIGCHNLATINMTDAPACHLHHCMWQSPLPLFTDKNQTDSLNNKSDNCIEAVHVLDYVMCHSQRYTGAQVWQEEVSTLNEMHVHVTVLEWCWVLLSCPTDDRTGLCPTCNSDCFSTPTATFPKADFAPTGWVAVLAGLFWHCFRLLFHDNNSRWNFA